MNTYRHGRYRAWRVRRMMRWAVRWLAALNAEDRRFIGKRGQRQERRRHRIHMLVEHPGEWDGYRVVRDV